MPALAVKGSGVCDDSVITPIGVEVMVRDHMGHSAKGKLARFARLQATVIAVDANLRRAFGQVPHVDLVLGGVDQDRASSARGERIECYEGTA